jgi:hypothetical protein
MQPLRSATRAFGTIGFSLVIFFGCGGTGETPAAPPTTPSSPSTVVRVSVSSTRTESDAIGDTIRFTAQAFNVSGAAVSGASITWTVSSSSVADIRADGLLTTKGNGSVVVTARLGDVSGATSILVTQRVTAIKASRDSVILDRWGDTATVSGVAVDRLGAAVSSAGVNLISADSTVAALAALNASSAMVRSGTDGFTTVNLVSAQDASMRAVVRVRVAVQRNASCRVPAAPASRGAAAGPATWDVSIIANSTIPKPDSVYAGPLVAASVIDADGDGDLDVLAPWYLIDSPQRTARTLNGMKVFRNDGGTLVDATAALWGSQPVSWSYPRVAVPIDVNGSGRKSVLFLDTGYDPAAFGGCGVGVSSCTGARKTLVMSVGGRLSNESARLSSNSPNAFSHAGAAADVDCDGDDDFFEGTWSNGTAPEPSHLHINTSGIFSADDGRLPADLPRREGFVGFTFCDLDRDGDPDGVTSLYGKRPRIMINDGFGRFRLLATSTIPEPIGGDRRAEYSAITCADFDGDGWNDVAMGRHSTLVENEAVTILLNNRNATFRDGSSAAVTTMSNAGNSAWPWTIDAADFNGDGWPDLLLTSPFAVGRILYATGGGRFAEWVFPENGSFYWMAAGAYPAVADFTGDGRPDVYVFRGQYDHVLLRNR